VSGFLLYFLKAHEIIKQEVRNAELIAQAAVSLFSWFWNASGSFNYKSVLVTGQSFDSSEPLFHHK
jgi:hypothetical protein